MLPEVVTGLSLLLLFVALEVATGWPAGRGALTVLLAHATLGAAFVAVVVQARLAETDRSLEEAAMDLGATPFTAFRTITLPLIAPALGAGWLLAFTLSLDDVVIASFVSGPAGTTLAHGPVRHVAAGPDAGGQCAGRGGGDRRGRDAGAGGGPDAATLLTFRAMLPPRWRGIISAWPPVSSC